MVAERAQRVFVLDLELQTPLDSASALKLHRCGGATALASPCSGCALIEIGTERREERVELVHRRVAMEALGVERDRVIRAVHAGMPALRLLGLPRVRRAVAPGEEIL